MTRNRYRIVRYSCGPRIYVAGRRVHHGPVEYALALVGLAPGDAMTMAIGAAFAAHDARDFPWSDPDSYDQDHDQSPRA